MIDSNSLVDQAHFQPPIQGVQVGVQVEMQMQVQVPREKEKNEDQEWWRRYYERPRHHERKDSEGSVNSDLSGSSSPDDTLSSGCKRDRSVLSSFPTPPRGVDLSYLRKPLPPLPVEKIGGGRGREEGGKGGRSRSRSLSKKKERVDLEKSIPPISLVRFHRGWRNDNDNSWSRLCSEGVEITIEQYGEMIDALDRAYAPSMCENVGSGMGGGEKGGWL